MQSEWVEEPYEVIHQLAKVDGATLVLASIPRGHVILLSRKGEGTVVLYALGSELDLDHVCKSCVEFERTLSRPRTADVVPSGEPPPPGQVTPHRQPTARLGTFGNSPRQRVTIESTT